MEAKVCYVLSPSCSLLSLHPGIVRKLLDLSLLGHTAEADGMVVGDVVVKNLTTEV